VPVVEGLKGSQASRLHLLHQAFVGGRVSSHHSGCGRRVLPTAHRGLTTVD
jgi:hypothetical protein